MSNNLNLRITLPLEKWDQSLPGWTCDALELPGAKLRKIRFKGNDVTHEFSQDEKDLIWSGKPKPNDSILVDIELTQDFNQLERDKLALEKEKLQLEKSKVKLDNRWKFVSAVLTLLGIFIGSITTYYVSSAKAVSPSSTPSPSPSSTPSPSPSSTPSPSPSSTPSTKNIYDLMFEKKIFPLPECGKVIDKEVNFTISIPTRSGYYRDVKDDFCEDAASWDRDTIQVASFTNEVDATEFYTFIQKHFKEAKKSKANRRS
jgi:hypothetical protein